MLRVLRAREERERAPPLTINVAGVGPYMNKPEGAATFIFTPDRVHVIAVHYVHVATFVAAVYYDAVLVARLSVDYVVVTAGDIRIVALSAKSEFP